ncbi:hypothetical protein GQ600_7251 [Phytophthora cactorum]|nr:hypothetical protein GQ600_7251 [Phytophthora cactorum]
MGAVLVCFGGHEPDFSEIRQRRDRTPSEDSLLDRLQKNWSCGSLGAEQDEDDDPSIAYWRRTTTCLLLRQQGQTHQRSVSGPSGAAGDYFLPLERRRTLSPPPIESLEMYCSSEDCFSTSSTMTSELDYWVSSDPLSSSEERRYDSRYLPPRPTLGRCASWGAPVHTGLKIHRTFSSSYKQEDSCFARFQSPSPKPFLSSTMGLAA